jgi:transcriptional regulator with XRE-family HTH domain
LPRIGDPWLAAAGWETMVGMDRAELADFVRRSRERLRPHEVGLPGGPRRRTPGLRREEVSQLAGISADYLMRLEQARSPQPSTQVLAALARALRLTEDERDHLYNLAGHRPPAGRLAGNHVRPGLLHLLDQLTATPAQILNDLGDVLAQNAMAQALFGNVCSERRHDCDLDHNILWRWFNDPALRHAFPADEHDHQSHRLVADVRAAAARRGYDADSTALVERLSASSTEFTSLWRLHEVAVPRHSRMRVLHPQVGPIVLDCEIMLTPSEDQRLLIFTAPPGAPDTNQLELLRVVGSEQFIPDR